MDVYVIDRGMTWAGYGVQSEGEKIIADRLYECGIDYVYDSLIEIDGEWIRPDFILPGLTDLIIEYKGMEYPEYNEKLKVREKAYDIGSCWNASDGFEAEGFGECKRDYYLID